MRIQSIKTISYSPKIISHKGDEIKSNNVKNKKEQNPYKPRNIFIGLISGFLFAYLLLKLIFSPIPSE